MKIHRSEKRKLKKSEQLTRKSFDNRGIVAACVILVMFAVLIGRLAYLQLIAYATYRDKALDTYTTEYKIPANRGTIYDRNMDVLAKSVTVETVFISPSRIKDENEAQLIADGLADILEIDFVSVLEKTSKVNTQYQIIKKNVELEDADAVRRFVLDNNLQKCVHLEESTKRVYTYDSLASHTIGFTGADNQGLFGLEAYYDDVLKGIDGKVLRGKDGLGNDLDIRYESYVDPVDGTSIVLTIDATIQSILEKYLQEAYDEHQPHNRAMGVIMDVNTGEILAMSIKPDFNLNSPYILDNKSQELLDAFIGTEEEKTAYKTELLYKMWGNKIISEPYETGSTFKVLTASMALEEDVVDLDDTFVCTGSILIGGFNIHCHKAGGHGTLTFAEALQNSCNPSFVQIGLRVGTDAFYKYTELFGFFEKTGIDLGGEAETIWHKQFNELELAVSAFGQTFKVTPIAHIRALATAANGGMLITPHLAKELIDSQGNVIETFNYEPTRQVISEETSKTVMEILQGGITVGSTKNANVEGYSIAAKTGTSQKRDQISDGSFKPYVSSCIAFAPADDPQIIIYIAIDEPDGQNHEFYGGLVAAPVVSKVLGEVLPYMKVPKSESVEDNPYAVMVDDLRGMSVEKAKDILSSKKLEYKVLGEGDTVTDQIPSAGETITEGGKVILYTDQTRPSGIEVPDVIGLELDEAENLLKSAGLNMIVTGSYQFGEGAKAASQSIQAGVIIAEGTAIKVEFMYYEVTD